MFCLRESISVQSFYAWRRRLRDVGQGLAGSAADSIGSAFVELRPDRQAEPIRDPAGGTPVTVRFPGGCELVADAAHLPRLVTLLAAMSIPAGADRC